jgi:hypothetical protein
MSFEYAVPIMVAMSISRAPLGRLPRAGAAVKCLAAMSMAVLLGACGAGTGASKSVGVAQVGKTTTTATPQTGPAVAGTSGVNQQVALAYAQCMRKNGEPGFPDPDSTGSFPISALAKLNRNSPQFQAAQQACQALKPKASASQVAQDNAEMLKFSACMRKHGEPSFPDLTLGSGAMSAARQYLKGVNVNSPQFQSALGACRSLLPPTIAGSIGG